LGTEGLPTSMVRHDDPRTRSRCHGAVVLQVVVPDDGGDEHYPHRDSCVLLHAGRRIRISSHGFAHTQTLVLLLHLSLFGSSRSCSSSSHLQTSRRCKLAHVQSARSIGVMCATLFGVCEDVKYLPLALPNCTPTKRRESIPCPNLVRASTVG
jgi:hypothetical protein